MRALGARDDENRYLRLYGIDIDGYEFADLVALDGNPELSRSPGPRAFVLDQLGTPLDAAILMDVDFDILKKRLTGRRTCSKTGKLLNIYFSSQEELDECTAAGGELIQREDDNEGYQGVH